MKPKNMVWLITVAKNERILKKHRKSGSPAPIATNTPTEYATSGNVSFENVSFSRITHKHELATATTTLQNPTVPF